MLALVLLVFVAGTLSAQDQNTAEPAVTSQEQDEGEEAVKDEQVGAPEAPDLEIAKTVDRSTANAGDTLEYMVVISNDGDSAAQDVLMTDTLPSEVSFVTGSINATGGLWGEAGGVVTWTGAIMNQDLVTITFQADINNNVPDQTIIVNTAEAGWNGNSYDDSAETTVTEEVFSPYTYLPAMFSPPPTPPGAPALSVSRPTFENKWTVAWTNPGGNVTSYELQESLTPDFANPTIYSPGLANSIQIQQELAPFNEYYYRVRAANDGGPGAWSNVGHVIAAYRDDFSSSINNWAIRRTTLIEEVTAYHEVRDGNGLLILKVEDSWDWGIASPMIKAPSPPYMIEYRTQVANLGNLVSHGLAFGADWPGTICPDWSTLPGVYEHDYCFNHFYLPNVIWYGPLKMQFERIDFLFWCPGCGGSPMKRLSDDYSTWFLVDPLGNAVADGWNTWRMEVRSDGLRMFLNGQQFATSGDTRWVNEPYFGAFGSTDEYSNSTTRWDYVEVRPLDN